DVAGVPIEFVRRIYRFPIGVGLVDLDALQGAVLEVAGDLFHGLDDQVVGIDAGDAVDVVAGGGSHPGTLAGGVGHRQVVDHQDPDFGCSNGEHEQYRQDHGRLDQGGPSLSTVASQSSHGSKIWGSS